MSDRIYINTNIFLFNKNPSQQGARANEKKKNIYHSTVCHTIIIICTYGSRYIHICHCVGILIFFLYNYYLRNKFITQKEHTNGYDKYFCFFVCYIKRTFQLCGSVTHKCNPIN